MEGRKVVADASENLFHGVLILRLGRQARRGLGGKRGLKGSNDRDKEEKRQGDLHGNEMLGKERFRNALLRFMMDGSQLLWDLDLDLL